MIFPLRPTAAATAGALLLFACATSIGPRAPSFRDLPGWAADDHAAALAAFRQACARQSAPDLSAVCARAQSLGRVDDSAARRFLETNFRLEPLREPGLLTAYFAPVFEARRTACGEFTAPVRPRPADLPPPDRGGGGAEPYADRVAIEARDAADSLAWMRPEELFLLQVQGSGTLVFEDGARVKAAFAGTNGAPYLAIGAVLRGRGLIAADASAEDIRRWLAANRGATAEAVMGTDRRYVFFRLLPDDGAEPVGAAGSPLVPGRSIAVDLASHHLGELFWLDATAPTIPGAHLSYRRLVVALDSGAAIKGESRVDLYLGQGDVAGIEAGRVRHLLRLYQLAPIAGRGS